MRKRRCLFSLILLLFVLFAPTGAVASPGAFESGGSALSAALSMFLELVGDLLAGELSSGIDPWGGTAPPVGTGNGDLSSGIDPDG